MSFRRSRHLLLALAAAPLLGAGSPAAPPEEAAPPPLAITAVLVTPAQPAPDTLCQLSVRLANRGEHVASRLAFRVRVAGEELAVYRQRRFLATLPPGEETELRLYNFWVSETGRPAPATGPLVVEVELLEATWTKMRRLREGDHEVEEWSPIGPVTGLPAAARTNVDLSR